MKKSFIVLMTLLVVFAAFGGAFAGPGDQGGPCPERSHNPGGIPPNCGQAPVEDPDPDPDPDPEGCPPAGDITGVLVGIGQEINANGGAPLGDVVIEVACAVFDLTGL